jgi:hypothetical protein
VLAGYLKQRTTRGFAKLTNNLSFSARPGQHHTKQHKRVPSLPAIGSDSSILIHVEDHCGVEGHSSTTNCMSICTYPHLQAVKKICNSLQISKGSILIKRDLLCYDADESGEPVLKGATPEGLLRIALDL